mmetsp:Transcript_99273/g.256700  ORF Transcript_99273/g.256700 Transcript_99273/m.256700 type:complete len:277 (-) Transcript_99273:148-978(-)
MTRQRGGWCVGACRSRHTHQIAIRRWCTDKLRSRSRPACQALGRGAQEPCGRMILRGSVEILLRYALGSRTAPPFPEVAALMWCGCCLASLLVFVPQELSQQIRRCVRLHLLVKVLHLLTNLQCDLQILFSSCTIIRLGWLRRKTSLPAPRASAFQRPCCLQRWRAPGPSRWSRPRAGPWSGSSSCCSRWGCRAGKTTSSSCRGRGRGGRRGRRRLLRQRQRRRASRAPRARARARIGAGTTSRLGCRCREAHPGTSRSGDRGDGASGGHSRNRRR